jgi:hypothetical protein
LRYFIAHQAFDYRNPGFLARIVSNGGDSKSRLSGMPADFTCSIDSFGFSLETPQTCVFVQFGAGEREALNLALDESWAGAFVLTDDREAINAAARTGIKTITAFDFFTVLKLTNRIADTGLLVQKLRNADEGINAAELKRMLKQTGEQ